MRRSCWFLSFAVLLFSCLAFPLYWRVEKLFEPEKIFRVSQNAEKCLLFEGIRGAEDSAVIASNIVVFGSDDRMGLWERKNGIEFTENGSLVVFFAAEDGEIHLSPLPLIGFPDDTAFHPHGIFLFKDNNKMLLFVVNHAYKAGGERIDVFEVKHQNPSSDNQFTPILTTYKYTLGEEYLSKASMGCSNDILVLTEGEFFVTQYMAFPDEETGRITNSWFSSTYRHLGNLFATITKRQWTHVRHCTYDASSPEISKPIQCNIVASGTSYNGINTNVAQNTLFVSDPVEREIHAYNLTTAHSEPLELIRNINLPYSVDNIELDKDTDTLFLSAIWRFTEHIERISSRSQGISPANNPGGAMQISFDYDSGSYSFREIVMQDGEKLSSISVACPFKDSKVLLGSWEDDGILMCPLPR